MKANSLEFTQMVENTGMSIRKIEIECGLSNGTLRKSIDRGGYLKDHIIDKVRSLSGGEPPVISRLPTRRELIEFLKSPAVRDENYGLAADEFFERFRDIKTPAQMTPREDETWRRTNFGKNVRSLLKTSKVTQNEFAEKIGVSPQNLSKLLKSSRPTVSTVERFANALGVQPNQLI